MYYINEKHCKDFEEDDEKNYCVHNGKNIHFIFNKYKTSYVIGRLEIVIPEILKKIILEYVNYNKIKNNTLLLGLIHDTSLSKIIKKMKKQY